MEQLTVSKFDELLEEIKKSGDDKRDPPVAKKLEPEHVKSLVEFLSTTDDSLLLTVITVLGDAARIAKNRDTIGALHPMPILMQTLKRNLSVKHNEKIVRVLGNLCYDHPYNREKIQETKEIQLIVNCLSDDKEHELQRLTCGCIANLSSTTEEICSEIYHLGGLKHLYRLLDSEDDNVQCMAARAIRNMSETEDIRMWLASNKIIERCVNILKNTEDDDGMILEFVGIMNAISQTKTICNDLLNNKETITSLFKALVNADNVELIVEIQEFLDSLTSNDVYKDLFIDHLPTIRKLYRDASVREEVRTCAGKLYANLSTSDKVYKDIYQELDQILPLLDDPSKNIQAVTGMIIGNLARSDDHCLDMVSRGVAKTLISIAGDEERDMRVRNYAVATIRNIAINEKNKPKLLELGAFKPACLLLKQPKMNHVIVYHSIGTIKSLLLGGDNFVDEFVKLGGLEDIIRLSDFDESDHVKYESCRVLSFLTKEREFTAVMLMFDRCLIDV
eukprot:TRINITY_DN1684_c1_g1_i2.p1 TRINITY_DN1684_c1_g1~~TRINITY_DN1684_c1_g1_i2.p1  ORF type:complete len:505 (-),score=125.74 TRINITY_DN1684_c1_g1_i2:581-2095(-)